MTTGTLTRRKTSQKAIDDDLQKEGGASLWCHFLKPELRRLSDRNLPKPDLLFAIKHLDDIQITTSDIKPALSASWKLKHFEAAVARHTLRRQHLALSDPISLRKRH